MNDFRSEIARNFNKAKLAHKNINSAQLGCDLRDAWEDFLTAFSKTIGKLITASIKNVKTKEFGYKLKNLSTKDDEALVFLREARNFDEHGLEPSAEYEDGLTSIFGAFGLGPNVRKAYFSGNTVNGVDTGTFTVSTDEYGKICELISDDPVIAAYHPAKIKLRDIYSDEKRKIFPVPSLMLGVSLMPETPSNLAEKALEFLSNKLAEFDAITNNK